MSISNCIQKLEDLLGTGTRLIVCSQPSDMTDEQLERYLASHGISTQTDDLVISLRRFGDGHPDPWVKVEAACA